MELSIDTSTRYASVAISRQGSIVTELSWRSEQNHSVELVSSLRSLMERAKVTVDQIEAIFVAKGPGGFSALRVGISFAKSLAMAQNVPLVGIGTLDIEAQPYLGLGRPVCAAIEAGRQAVYLACYGHAGRTTEAAAEYRVAAHEDLVSFIGDGTLICGEAAATAADVLKERGKTSWHLIDARPPTRRPGALAWLGYNRCREGDTDAPETLQPVYMRGTQFRRAQQVRAASGSRQAT